MWTKPEDVLVCKEHLGVKFSPLAKVISRMLNRFSRFISWINLGVNYMGLGKRLSDNIMHMSWEARKTIFVPQKAMDVD